MAARWIDFTDVDDVKFVINFDYPNNSEDYVHRIGRTGRLDKTGTAYTFFTPANANKAKDLVAVLQEANQVVNPKLFELVSSSGFGKRGRGNTKRDDRGFGGRGMSRGSMGVNRTDGGMNRNGGDRRADRNDRQRDSGKRSRFSDGPGKNSCGSNTYNDYNSQSTSNQYQQQSYGRGYENMQQSQSQSQQSYQKSYSQQGQQSQQQNFPSLMQGYNSSQQYQQQSNYRSNNYSYQQQTSQQRSQPPPLMSKKL